MIHKQSEQSLSGAHSGDDGGSYDDSEDDEEEEARNSNNEDNEDESKNGGFDVQVPVLAPFDDVDNEDAIDSNTNVQEEETAPAPEEQGSGNPVLAPSSAVPAFASKAPQKSSSKKPPPKIKNSSIKKRANDDLSIEKLCEQIGNTNQEIS